MRITISLALTALAGVGAGIGLWSSWPRPSASTNGPEEHTRANPVTANATSPSSGNEVGSLVFRKVVWAPDRLGCVQVSVLRPFPSATPNQWVVVLAATDVRFDTDPITGSSDILPSAAQTSKSCSDLVTDSALPISVGKWLYTARPKPGRTWLTASVDDDIEVTTTSFSVPVHPYEKAK